MSGKGTPKKIEATAAKAAGARPTPSPLPVIGTPGVESVLGVLPNTRLLDLCRLFGCEVHDIAGGKERLVRKLAGQLTGRLPAVLREFGRDELRSVCRRHGLDPSARARADLQGLVLEAAGLDPRELSLPPTPEAADGLPVKGQIVHARHRQWLVDDVQPGGAGESPLVRLICLDDDDPGRQIDVLCFTEYADTKRYLVELLTAAVAHTDMGEQRIRQFHGGMGDDARDEVQRAFNSDPNLVGSFHCCRTFALGCDVPKLSPLAPPEPLRLRGDFPKECLPSTRCSRQPRAPSWTPCA